MYAHRFRSTPSPKGQRESGRRRGLRPCTSCKLSPRSKSLQLSLNDEALGLQIASNDDESCSLTELIEHLETGLSQKEQPVVRHLKTDELAYPQARRFMLEEAGGSIPTRPGWKLQRYAAEIGMMVEEFFQIIWRIRSKCRVLVEM